jgi:hypothetical protein
MKKKLLLFSLACLTGAIIASSAAYAQNVYSDDEDFTLTIPELTIVEIDDTIETDLTASALTAADLNATTNNGGSGNHQVVIGDGDGDGSGGSIDTYVQSNERAGKTLHINITGDSVTNKTIISAVNDAADGTNAITIFRDADDDDTWDGLNLEAQVDILIVNTAGNAKPRIGYDDGAGDSDWETFGTLSLNAGTANMSITASDLPINEIDGAEGKLWLDFMLDLDESTVGWDDPPTTMGITVEISVADT